MQCKLNYQHCEATCIQGTNGLYFHLFKSAIPSCVQPCLQAFLQCMKQSPAHHADTVSEETARLKHRFEIADAVAIKYGTTHLPTKKLQVVKNAFTQTKALLSSAFSCGNGIVGFAPLDGPHIFMDAAGEQATADARTTSCSQQLSLHKRTSDLASYPAQTDIAAPHLTTMLYTACIHQCAYLTSPSCSESCDAIPTAIALGIAGLEVPQTAAAVLGEDARKARNLIESPWVTLVDADTRPVSAGEETELRLAHQHTTRLHVYAGKEHVRMPSFLAAYIIDEGGETVGKALERAQWAYAGGAGTRVVGATNVWFETTGVAATVITEAPKGILGVEVPQHTPFDLGMNETSLLRTKYTLANLVAPHFENYKQQFYVDTLTGNVQVGDTSGPLGWSLHSDDLRREAFMHEWGEWQRSH